MTDPRAPSTIAWTVLSSCSIHMMCLYRCDVLVFPVILLLRRNVRGGVHRQFTIGPGRMHLVAAAFRQQDVVDVQGQWRVGDGQQVCSGVPQGRTASEQHAKLERHFAGDNTLRQTAAYVRPSSHTPFPCLSCPSPCPESFRTPASRPRRDAFSPWLRLSAPIMGRGSLYLFCHS